METHIPNMTSRHTNRNTNRPASAQTSKARDYAGAVPKIGGILASRSEYLSHKVNYDIFCQKLGVNIINKFKNGKHVVQIVKDPSADVVAMHEANFKPADLTNEEENHR